MPTRTRINGCSKIQLGIILAYLSCAAGGALLLSLTSLNDDIQGVAPKDMALLGAVIGAGASVVLDNVVRWRFDEPRVDDPNRYFLGGLCVGLAALGAFGFPYVHGPADTVPGQFKAAAGAFLTCLMYVIIDQVVRRRYDQAHELKEEAAHARLLAPARAETAAERKRADVAEAEVRRLQAERLAEARAREAEARAENRELRAQLSDSAARTAEAHAQGAQQTASLFAGAFNAFTHAFGMGSATRAQTSTPGEASGLLRIGNLSRSTATAADTGARAPLLLLDDATPRATSQRSTPAATFATTGSRRAPTATPPVALIRG